MLLGDTPPFKIILPNYFSCTDDRLNTKIKVIFDARPDDKIPFLYKNDANIPGVSFWMETV